MGTYRIPVKIEGTTTPGGPWMNVLHVRTVDDAETGELGSALDALEEFYDGVRGFMPASVTITLGEGMIRDPLGSPEYVNDDRRVLQGSGAENQHMSALLAVVVSWRTSSATRSGRGRTFVGPLVWNAQEGNGTPSSTVLAAINTSAADLVSASKGTNGWSFGVLSTQQGLFRDVTGHSVRDRFAFLSSRRD